MNKVKSSFDVSHSIPIEIKKITRRKTSYSKETIS